MTSHDESIKKHLIDFIRQDRKNRLIFKALALKCSWFEPVEHCQRLNEKCSIDTCPLGSSERIKD